MHAMNILKNQFLWLLGSLLIGLGPTNASSAPRLNFIHILVDDWGWTDGSGFGSRFYETPNIDRLAARGMKFSQAYAACTVCSPTRACTLTGQYPARLHITDWISGHVRPNAKLKVPDWTMHLPLDQMNIARRLKAEGYATASIGKWHLGTEDYYPDKQGFDINMGGTDRGQPPRYVAPYRIPTLPEGPPGEFLTDREAAEAMQFIEQNKAQPFFIYLAHYAVHQPIAGKPPVIAKYRQKASTALAHQNPTYAALVESVDDSVGAILNKLEELHLADRTVIVLTSDNGGLLPVTSNLPLRAGKGSAYEGGVRVPCVIVWPGTTQPGSVCDTPIISADFYPTLLALAGIADAAGHVVDGESLAPLLKQTGQLKREAIYWHYPHYHPGGATPYGAIRSGDFKLIEFFEDQHVELYNLREDLGEKQDLSQRMAGKAAELRQKLKDWRIQVGAQMPAPNPNYQPAKDRKPQAMGQSAIDHS